MDGIEIRAFLFRTAKEAINATNETQPSQRNFVWESAKGAMGLKNTVIATKAAPQMYFLALRAWMTTARAPTHTTNSSTTR